MILHKLLTTDVIAMRFLILLIAGSDGPWVILYKKLSRLHDFPK